MISALVGCGKFQDPNVVVDLRVIAMTASVPEQVIDIDLKNPPPPSQILPQLVPNGPFGGRAIGRWAGAPSGCGRGRPHAV